MADDGRKYLAERVAALSFAMAALIDHLAAKDPALRLEMADRLREFAKDDGDEHHGVSKGLEAIARQLDLFEETARGRRPYLRLVDKEPDQDV